MKVYIDGLYSWENDAGRRRVLASAIVHLREYYCAVEHIHPGGTRSVWAGMALLDYPRNRKNGLKFGYKEMDEMVGPVHANCP